jgi:hypothetical protein
MTCLFFHLWTQWEQYERGFDIRQRRHCKTCGYKQDREVGHH